MLPTDSLRVGWSIPKAVLDFVLRVLAVVPALVLIVGLTIAYSVVGAVPIVNHLWTWTDRLRITPWRMESLAPDPSPEEWFPVQITIWQRGVKTASDEGMVSFADGWLVYEGRRTQFAIRNGDASLIDAESSRLRLTDGSVAELIPFHRLGQRQNLRRGFEEGFARWFNSVRPQGRSVLPPKNVDPRTWGGSLAAIIVGISILLSVPDLSALLCESFYLDSLGWVPPNQRPYDAGFWDFATANVIGIAGLACVVRGGLELSIRARIARATA